MLSLFAPAALAQEGRGDVVYVPTPQVVVDEMLSMAKIGPKDFLIDLGSGDGRIVITAAKKFGAQGFGVDLDTYLLRLARESAKKEGVADRAQFVEQNLFETDLAQGDGDLELSAAGDEPEAAARRCSRSSPARASSRTTTTWATGIPDEQKDSSCRRRRSARRA